MQSCIFKGAPLCTCAHEQITNIFIFKAIVKILFFKVTLVKTQFLVQASIMAF